MTRPRGLSVRWKLTLSYVGFLVAAGALLLTVVWLFLLRYVPERAIPTNAGFSPGRADLLRAFQPAATAVMVFLLVFGLVGGWFLAGRMLAPLTKITRATRLAATGSLSHRVELAGRDDEFRELGDAFDSMLAHVEAHVAEQQRFAANASHELRTPLAITRALLDVAQQDPDGDLTQTLARLRETNERAVALTEALLQLSRAGNAHVTRDVVDLSLLAEEAAETLLPLAEQHGTTIEVVGTVATASGSGSLLLQVAMNLVHNAIVHNLPSDGMVWVTTAHAGPTVTLTVENTGAVLHDQQVGMFTEPFHRGALRTRGGEDTGVGLGLAIVSRIVQAHGGAITLTPRSGGGLSARVELPGAYAG